MEFQQHFKEEVFKTFQYENNIEKLMDSLEKNDFVAFRFLIEIILDKIDENLKPRIIIDDGDRLVWNSIFNYWLQANRVYADFMDQYLEELEVHSDLQVNTNNESNNNRF